MTTINTLWNDVVTAGRAMRLDKTGPAYEWGIDDDAMRDATADDLLAWVDDAESRMGCDVGDFRAAVLDYLIIRDGADSDPDMVERAADLLPDDAALIAWGDRTDDSEAVADYLDRMADDTAAKRGEA